MGIPMATIGGLMKNFDITSPRLEWLRFDGHAGTDFLQALYDYAFAGLDPLANDPLVPDRLAEVHFLNPDLVSRIDGGNLVSALKLTDSSLRNQDHVLFGSSGNADAAVLARP